VSLSLGVIGMSSGNGHPYSWSAIMNGFDSFHMKNSEFPIIYEYLSKQLYPEDFIKDAKVTHIWTQDINLSKKISYASRIANVCHGLDDMIGAVDAILLARDDYENHFFFAKKFLENGIPIYIDKPIANSVNQARYIYSKQKFKGQIFTCSALRYSEELLLKKVDRKNIGKLKSIEAVVPKSWDKYSIHVIDPIIESVGYQGEVLSYNLETCGASTVLNFLWESGVKVKITATGNDSDPIKISYLGHKNKINYTFKDAFQPFKSALQNFIKIVKDQSYIDDIGRNLEVVKIIELGNPK